MSTSASVTVLDENGHGLSGVGVYLDDISRLRVIQLGKDVTNTDGRVTFSYAADAADPGSPGKQARLLRLRVQVGQHVLKEVQRADSPQALTFDPITLKTGERDSRLATLGTGAPARVTQANAVRWLVDNEAAWGRVQDVIEFAGTHKGKLDVMQLQIDVEDFSHAFRVEKPLIVLRFDPNAPLDAAHRRLLNEKDVRIERSLLAQVQRGTELRIQIPKMRLDRRGLAVVGAITGLTLLLVVGALCSILVAVILAVAVPIAGISTVLYLVEHRDFSTRFGRRKLSRWFDQAIADLQSAPPTNPPAPPLGAVRIVDLRLRSNNVFHTKMVVDRDVEAVLLGSPFEQHYFDSQHVLEEPRRGRDASKGPIHEMSVAVRGPAVGHLQEVFNSHWNIAEPSDPLPPTPGLPDAPANLNDGEFRCSVQVVRTFDKMFAPATDGEKGVLEAYLRGFHFAERFIYIENQYFNNDTITQGLIDALKAKPKLEVILLLNPAPDMPMYLSWQQKAIQKIIDALGGEMPAKGRLGVFSTWTHASKQSTGQSHPTLVDNYLHTKSALIDNRWATVGSANLDGVSLDFLQYLPTLLDGDVRNTETNVVVFDDVSPTVPAVDALRRRLWSEHLGLPETDLADAPDKRWLPVWRQQADAKKAALTANLDTVVSSRVLEWPSTSFEQRLCFCDRLRADRSHSTARVYLQELLKPKDVPAEIVASNGPGSYEFTYGAFPNTTVPGSTPASAAATPIAGAAAIADDEAAAT